MRPSILFGTIATVSCAFLLAVPVGSTAQDSLGGFSHSAQKIENDELIRATDLALRGKRLTEAEALLSKLPDEQLSDVERDDVRLLRGEFLIAVGRPGEAGTVLRTLSVEARSRCRVVIARATADAQSQDFVNAEMLLRSAVNDCSEDPAFWRTLGQASFAVNSSSNAVFAYRQALALEPENLDLQNDLAVALIANGNVGAAHGLLATVFLQVPHREDIAINLDYAAAMLGRMPQRRSGDNDAFWSRRLQFAGAGARDAGRAGLAEALYAQAVIENPRHDEQLWQQYKGAAQQR